VSVAEQNLDAPPAEAAALQEAFDRFCEQTARLQVAYEELKEEAERVNLELEEANRQLERRLRELDEAYNFQSSILESIPSAVVVTDLEGVVRTWNAAAETMWGAGREQALGRSFREVMGAHGDLLAGVLEGRRRRETLRRELGGPEPRVISSTACLVEDSAGRPIGAVQVDRDMTRLCELESRLHHHEKLADLGKMAAGLAHEIRKPLNGIKGFASLLDRKLEPEAADRRYVGNIMGAADRLNDMLGRLLDFARPDRLRTGRCDLRAEAESVLEFVRAEQADSPAELTLEVPEEARYVTADADKLKQVLLNLVKNGVEALDGPGRVGICSEAEPDGGVRVSVRDTGRGMAPEEAARVLDPFYSTRPGGTGLGLAVVDRILQLHGTQLEVKSRPGAGTSMEFVLPRDRRGDDQEGAGGR
jgi:PAS domain S-box-containing protein